MTFLQKIISKREPCRQIIIERLKQGYVINSTYIPIEFCKNTKFKYILNIVDLSSKSIISYPIKKMEIQLKQN